MRKPIKPVADGAKIVMKNYQKDKAKKYGMEYIEPTQPKWFVSYPFMVALMAVLQVLTVIFGQKMLLFFGFQVSAGWIFLMPVLIYIFQIVAECYGWQYARQLVWVNFVVNSLLAVIMSLFALIPINNADHYDIEYAYKILLLYQTPASITMLCGMFLSDLIASTLMCWSRFQFSGRFVIVRILILHCVSEIIVLSGGFITGATVGFSALQIWHFSLDSFLARSIVMLFLLPFARLIIWLIQHKVEKVVVFDLNARFNPFKFGINPTDSVQFNADGWDKIDIGKINLKEFAEYHSNELLETQHQKQMEEFNNRNHKQQ